MYKKVSVLMALALLLNTALYAPVSSEDGIELPKSYDGVAENEGKAGHLVEADIQNATLSGNASFGKYGGKDNVILLPSNGDAMELSFKIPAEGYYAMAIEYSGMIESDKAIKLCFKIDGEIPFQEASSLELPRCYSNETNDFEVDSLGNDIRPVQKQIAYWTKTPLFRKDIGTVEPYMFNLSAGEHEISITAENGGVCIGGVAFYQDADLMDYASYIAQYSGKEYAKGGDIILQGEKADRKSDISLYPITDRTSCATVPFSEKVTRLNTIGGSNWSYPGQWIEWDFTVEQAGFYEIALRVRQNANQGMKCYRTISINGEIPFDELKYYGFAYHRSWYSETLSDPATGEPFKFYFEPGTYTLRMEATTGELCKPLSEVSRLLAELNNLYHSIIMITGTSPDPFRDYNLDKAIPGISDTMLSLADRLDAQMKSIQSITGGSGMQAVSITTLSDQLRTLAAHPKSVSDRISNFYSNISAVSAWVNTALRQPLEIDYICIGAQAGDKIRVNPGFFESLLSGAKSFLYSFIVDYDSIGDKSADADIVVWATTGREQAESLKLLIDRDFLPRYHINVSLKLVQSGLVEAIAAGNGPDVALSLNMNMPVDLASRKVLEPLDSFEGFDEHVLTQFYQNSLIPFRYRGHTYALPETQEFNLMFYRTDILEQLGLDVPKTWDDIVGMLPVLARNNMQIGIPSLTTTSAGVINTSFPRMLLTLFMQYGVNFYSDDLRSTNLNTPEAVKAFQLLADFYNKYGLPVYFDAHNRFRTGEMPIIISTLSTYNTLSISAPEIAGRWGVEMIPGTKQPDGSINRADEYTSTGCVIFSSSKNKQSCWEFLRWWTEEQTQYDYGMELEAVLGVSGRYLTANKLAFQRLPWDSGTSEIITAQWEQASTVPQVPGYYFVSRYLTNALSDTILNGESARVVIDRYSDNIDSELKRKNEQINKLWDK